MLELLARDLRLAGARGWGWTTGVLFFVLLAASVAIALGGEAVALRAVGPGVLWAGLLIGVLLGATELFQADIDNGALDQMRLKGLSLWQIAGARLCLLVVLNALPLALATPLVAELFALPGEVSGRLMGALVASAPALAGYGVLAGALSARAGAGSLLGVLVTLPLLVPVIIFGSEVVSSEAASVWSSPEIRALVGLSLIGAVVGLAGAVAALGVNTE